MPAENSIKKSSGSFITVKNEGDTFMAKRQSSTKKREYQRKIPVRGFFVFPDNKPNSVCPASGGKR
ncbi:MAG: hypothetical protein A2750_01860 [Candidatus Yanofskybacteria bacterium RIFCSPHIGHO2_01_FULL_45_42]|uniref:Uncharacterized protein n=2 Tax=Candidatus Yanofskyibacteriota TaxID=1752733 RepID=A0A1F8F879_9BACT|nr:MAG: hypothetical protein A2750_01860 [Candidatus Yanofskybacteria bacterium RIFCSPHIGHO2_01_FULL_45_42]OGN32196.1 MAG: hypothetical protein A3J01_01235 [Candidatus Yanofskybacteria bacterium RIFCSPLOWO2_02_FULL_45_18]